VLVICGLLTVEWQSAMEVTLPADLTDQLQKELASGLYRNSDELFEQAVRHFLNERHHGAAQLEALRRSRGRSGRFVRASADPRRTVSRSLTLGIE
jgi:Arc/MetJ-type ribon-helix-helix transcriptional regulator